LGYPRGNRKGGTERSDDNELGIQHHGKKRAPRCKRGDDKGYVEYQVRKKIAKAKKKYKGNKGVCSRSRDLSLEKG
jgi:hypothetical protein